MQESSATAQTFLKLLFEFILCHLSCPLREGRMLVLSSKCNIEQADFTDWMCVCVFILFHLLVSSDCTTSETYVRSSDQRSFVVSISGCCCQVPSSLSPNLSYFTSKDENSSQPLTGEKTIWYNVWNPSKRWYILI